MVERAIRHPARPLIAIGVVATVVAVAAVVAVLLLGADARLPAIAPPATIAVHAEFDPADPSFGDRIDAKVVIALNRRTVRPATLRYTYGLVPLTPLGPARVSRSTSGDLELVTLVAPVTCVSAACLTTIVPKASNDVQTAALTPKVKGVTTLNLPRVHASVMRANGTRQSLSTPLPPLPIRGRVLSADLGRSPSFEGSASAPAPSYRIAPSLLSTLLDVLAAVCAVGAIALIAWQALLFTRRRPAPRAGALERALLLAREAQTMPVPHRRRALGLLARLLGRDRLSAAASKLAWSEHKPGPDELEALVSEIEQTRGG